MANTIGAMREYIGILIPLREVTELGGEVITWGKWIETWADIKTTLARDAEQEIETRTTAIRSISVRIRYRASVQEDMVIVWKGKQYDIIRVNEILDTPRDHYMQLTGVYREEEINVGNVPDDLLVAQFVQLTENYSGDSWLITAGTVPTDLSAENIHMVVFFYRSGVRMVYGIDWEYDGQRIAILQSKVRNEHLLYQQYTRLL